MRRARLSGSVQNAPTPRERIESGLLSCGGDSGDATNPFEVRLSKYSDMDKIMKTLSDAEATFQEREEMNVLTELKPGVMYSEKELAEVVGFDRKPVRKALQRLEIEGLVAIK